MIIIFLILFWLKKTIFLFGFFFKLFLLFMLIVVIGSIIFSYTVVKDANDFKNNFGNSTSIFIVKHVDNSDNSTESFLAGMTINPENKTLKYMNESQLSYVEQLYKENKLTTLGSEYYKVFIINLKSFDNVGLYNITDQNIQLNKSEMNSVMLSNDARDELASILANRTGEDKDAILKRLAYSNEEIKGYILSYYMSTVLNPANMAVFLSQFKDNSIKVYDETPLFKAIKLIPQPLINMIIKNSANDINTTVNTTLQK
jgi:hypothetical protein